jgi:hypothetical protein
MRAGQGHPALSFAQDVSRGMLLSALHSTNWGDDDQTSLWLPSASCHAPAPPPLRPRPASPAPGPGRSAMTTSTPTPPSLLLLLGCRSQAPTMLLLRGEGLAPVLRPLPGSWGWRGVTSPLLLRVCWVGLLPASPPLPLLPRRAPQLQRRPVTPLAAPLAARASMPPTAAPAPPLLRGSQAPPATKGDRRGLAGATITSGTAALSLVAPGSAGENTTRLSLAPAPPAAAVLPATTTMLPAPEAARAAWMAARSALREACRVRAARVARRGGPYMVVVSSSSPVSRNLQGEQKEGEQEDNRGERERPGSAAQVKHAC